MGVENSSLTKRCPRYGFRLIGWNCWLQGDSSECIYEGLTNQPITGDKREDISPFLKAIPRIVFLLQLQRFSIEYVVKTKPNQFTYQYGYSTNLKPK